MNRIRSGLSVVLFAAAVWAGCIKDPTGSLRGSAASVVPSVKHIVVTVGDSAIVTAQSLDAQGNTLAELPTVTSTTPTIITVIELSNAPIPQKRFAIKALTYGVGKVVVTAGSATDTITVQTYPARIDIAGVADTLRSGAKVAVTTVARSATGAVVAGFPITLTTSSATILPLNTARDTATATIVGTAVLTATGPGGTLGTLPVTVIPGVPATAAFSAATFGAVGVAGTARREVRVLDAAGNQNRVKSEITTVSITSSNTAAATIVVSVVDTAVGNTARQIFVTGTGVAEGTTNIGGSVTTSTGVKAVANAKLDVLNPVITSTTLNSASGATVSITGSGLSFTGYATVVTVGGKKLGNFTIVSPTQIDAAMPSYTATGAYQVRVSVGGVNSNIGTWNETVAFNETEATNDNPTTATALTVPFNFSGTFEGAPEEDDFFRFTLTAASTIINMNMTFAPGSKDLDILVTNNAVSSFLCFDGATGANPEHSTCTLPAGTYVLYLNDYTAFDAGDTTPATYTITGEIP